MRQAFASLLGLILSLIIIAILLYFMLNIFKPNFIFESSKKKGNYGKDAFSLIEKTKSKLKEVNQKLKYRSKEIEKTLHW
ncbi:MAG: hypothetical protein B6D56_07645 [Candidatus Omnitrophica bacterium 4484_70.1]|nr:MAG: hypothetical protein B6D56_07645 [Candidatus Omnitrophica bacterium 4484_70.1]